MRKLLMICVLIGGCCPNCIAQGVQERVDLPDERTELMWWTTFVDDGSPQADLLRKHLAYNSVLHDMWTKRTRARHRTADDRFYLLKLKHAIGGPPVFCLQTPADADGKGSVVYKVSGRNIPATSAEMVRGIRLAIANVRGDRCPKPSPPKPTPPDDTSPIIPDTVPDEDEVDVPEGESPGWLRYVVLAGCGVAGAAGGYVFRKKS